MREEADRECIPCQRFLGSALVSGFAFSEVGSAKADQAVRRASARLQRHSIGAGCMFGQQDCGHSAYVLPFNYHSYTIHILYVVHFHTFPHTAHAKLTRDVRFLMSTCLPGTLSDRCTLAF